MFHLFKDDLRGCVLDKMSYSDTLQIHFSTGAIQVCMENHVHSTLAIRKKVDMENK